MKCIFLLALLGLLLPACQPHGGNADLNNKVADLEYRVSLLEKLLAEKEATSKSGLPDGAASYGSGSPAIKAEGQYTGSSNSIYSARCQAITKKGSQCKRNARSAGYCWQHGG